MPARKGRRATKKTSEPEKIPETVVKEDFAKNIEPFYNSCGDIAKEEVIDMFLTAIDNGALGLDVANRIIDFFALNGRQEGLKEILNSCYEERDGGMTPILFKVIAGAADPKNDQVIFTNILRRMLHFGADPNSCQEKIGSSLLFFAIQKDCGLAVKFLLEAGADINCKQKTLKGSFTNALTPFVYAVILAMTQSRNSKIVDLIFSCLSDEERKRDLTCILQCQDGKEIRIAEMAVFNPDYANAAFAFFANCGGIKAYDEEYQQDLLRNAISLGNIKAAAILIFSGIDVSWLNDAAFKGIIDKSEICQKNPVAVQKIKEIIDGKNIDDFVVDLASLDKIKEFFKDSKNITTENVQGVCFRGDEAIKYLLEEPKCCEILKENPGFVDYFICEIAKEERRDYEALKKLLRNPSREVKGKLIVFAFRNGDSDLMRMLIEEGVTADAVVQIGNLTLTLLGGAILNNDSVMTSLLIEKGADVNALFSSPFVEREAVSALDTAIIKRSLFNIDAILRAGGDYRDYLEKEEEVDGDALRHIKKFDEERRRRDEDRLLLAIDEAMEDDLGEFENESVDFKELESCLQRLNLVTDEGQVKELTKKAAKILLAIKDFDFELMEINNMLFYALRRENILAAWVFHRCGYDMKKAAFKKGVSYLEEKIDFCENFTPLHFVAAGYVGDNVKILDFLIDKCQMDIDLKVEGEESSKMRYPIELATRYGCDDMVFYLLEKGAKYIFEKPHSSGSILYHAIDTKEADFQVFNRIVDFFLLNGKDEELKKLAQTCYYDIDSEGGYLQTPILYLIIQVLAQKKAQTEELLEQKQKYEKLAMLHYSPDFRKNCDILQKLIPSCDREVIEFERLSDRSLKMIKALLKAGMDPNFKGDRKFEAIFRVIDLENHAIFRALVEAGANLDCELRDPRILQNGVSPFIFAIIYGKIIAGEVSITAKEGCIEMARTVFSYLSKEQKKKDLNHIFELQNGRTRSLLNIAASSPKCIMALQFLLHSGAKVTREAIDIAINSDNVSGFYSLICNGFDADPALITLKEFDELHGGKGEDLSSMRMILENVESRGIKTLTLAPAVMPARLLREIFARSDDPQLMNSVKPLLKGLNLSQNQEAKILKNASKENAVSQIFKTRQLVNLFMQNDDLEVIEMLLNNKEFLKTLLIPVVKPDSTNSVAENLLMDLVMQKSGDEQKKEYLIERILGLIVKNKLFRIDACLNGTKLNIPSLFCLMGCKNMNSLRMIIEECGGADVSKDPSGYTMLCNAAMRGNIAMMECLIEAGADVNYLISEKYRNAVFEQEAVKNNFSPLSMAIQAGEHDAMRVLIKNGADVNLQRFDGKNSPLQAAIDCKDVMAVDILVKSGAKLPEKEVESWAIGKIIDKKKEKLNKEKEQKKKKRNARQKKRKKQKEKENSAAVIIQSAFRGLLARKGFQNRKQKAQEEAEAQERQKKKQEEARKKEEEEKKRKEANAKRNKDRANRKKAKREGNKKKKEENTPKYVKDVKQLLKNHERKIETIEDLPLILQNIIRKIDALENHSVRLKGSLVYADPKLERQPCDVDLEILAPGISEYSEEEIRGFIEKNIGVEGEFEVFKKFSTDSKEIIVFSINFKDKSGILDISIVDSGIKRQKSSNWSVSLDAKRWRFDPKGKLEKFFTMHTLSDDKLEVNKKARHQILRLCFLCTIGVVKKKEVEGALKKMKLANAAFLLALHTPRSSKYAVASVEEVESYIEKHIYNHKLENLRGRLLGNLKSLTDEFDDRENFSPEQLQSIENAKEAISSMLGREGCEEMMSDVLTPASPPNLNEGQDVEIKLKNSDYFELKVETKTYPEEERPSLKKTKEDVESLTNKAKTEVRAPILGEKISGAVPDLSPK